MSSSPLVIAHRGASGEAPENTVAAFVLAVDQGAGMIETDLHRTRDGAVVLVHDAVLPGGRGVHELTLAELRASELPALASIPTLEEALDAVPGIAWNLELKRGVHGTYPGLASIALGEAKRRDLLPRVLFSSFERATLAELRALSSQARVAVLMPRDEANPPISQAISLRAEAVHPHRTRVNERLVGTCHEAKLAVHPYTVDKPAEMRWMIGLGVDGLFTNWPARLKALLADSGSGSSLDTQNPIA